MIEDKIQDLFDDLRLDLITSKDFDSKAMITAITKEQTILIMNIINENKKLKQLLNEIREYVKSTGLYETNINPDKPTIYNLELLRINDKFLQIIDKYIGSDK